METKPSSLVYEIIAPTTSGKSSIKLEVEHPVDNHISYKDEESISPLNPLCGSKADNDTPEVCVIKPEDIVEIPELEIAEIYNGKANGTCNTSTYQENLAITKIECESSIKPKVNSKTDDVNYEALVEDGSDTKICQFLESDEIDIKFDSQNCMDFFEEEENRNDAPFSNLSSDFNRELKIILKDILVDQKSGAKIVLKYVTVPLIKIDVETMAKQTSLKIRNNRKLSANKSKKQTKKRNYRTDQIFKCTECDFQSHFLRCVKSHYRYLHIPRKKLHCPYCTANNFNTQREVNLHMWIKHRRDIPDLAEKWNIPLFVCDICKYKTINSTLLETHKMSHGRFEDTKMLSCTECSYTALLKSNMARHLRQKHNENKEVHQCSYCNKNIFDKYNFADHLLKLHNDKIDKGLEKIFTYTIIHCKLCDFRTMKQCKLNYHMTKHGDMSKVPVLKCYHCKYETLLKKHLITHMTSHYGSQYTCKYCEERFSREISLDAHLLKNHKEHHETIRKELGDRIFSCKLCSYETVWQTGLICHMLQHEESSNTNKYTCKKCDFKTDLKRFLISHRKTHQKKGKTCSLCNKLCNSLGALGNHILQKHKSKQGKALLDTLNCKIYTCKICKDFQSAKTFHFKQHMYNTHNDKSYSTASMENTLSCSQCEYKASYNCHLKAHIRSKHSGKHSNCAYCTRSFPNNRSLAVHLLKNHKREVLDSKSKEKKEVLGYKVLSCNICNKFEELEGRSFLNHMFYKHGDRKNVEVCQCYTCGYETLSKIRLVNHLKSHNNKTGV